MRETEVRLRKAVNELLHVVRMNSYMKKAQSELIELLDGSTMSLEIFEGKPGSEKLTDTKKYFEELLQRVKISYGASAISATYNCFKSALDDIECLESLGIDKELKIEEKSELFKKVFDIVVPVVEKWNFENDFFSYFIETVKEILMPTGELNMEKEEICPYCDGIPKKISKTEFFGPRSADTDGHVWACECGAYAFINDDGTVAGKLGDTMLHQKRNLVKGALCELCSLAGMTCYESYRWFSLITGYKISSVTDVEYLDVESCNLALKLYICVKHRIKEMNYVYPKDRNELFMFFADGGRLMVCNAFGFQYGALLIPTEIGPEGIRIYGREGKQSISFAAGLQYEFKDDQIFVVHPSGKKEKYRMMPAEIRDGLFSLKKEDIMAIKAV